MTIFPLSPLPYTRTSRAPLESSNQNNPPHQQTSSTTFLIRACSASFYHSSFAFPPHLPHIPTFDTSPSIFVRPHISPNHSARVQRVYVRPKRRLRSVHLALAAAYIHIHTHRESTEVSAYVFTHGPSNAHETSDAYRARERERGPKPRHSPWFN